MSVESVNGKTGVVTLTASNVEAVPTSEVGQPSGVASLNSGGELPEAQLPSSVVTSSANPSEAGEILTSEDSSSRAGIYKSIAVAGAVPRTNVPLNLVTDFGASGNARIHTASTTEGLTTVGVVSAKAEWVGMYIVGAGIPRGSKITAAVEGAKEITISHAATATSASVKLTIGSDNSAAFKSLWESLTSSVISNPLANNNNQNSLFQRGADIPAGVFLIASAGGLMNGVTPSAQGFTLRGQGRGSTYILFAPTEENKALLKNSEAYFDLTFQGITFGCADTTADFFQSIGPTAQNYKFMDCNWHGEWRYGFNLTGTNNNSEFKFYDPGIYGKWTAFLYSPSEAEGGSDQFLDYWFFGCSVQMEKGNFVEMGSGGHIHGFGASLIHSGNGEASQIFFNLLGKAHSEGTPNVSWYGLRVEHRHIRSQLVVCEWENGTVLFNGYDGQANLTALGFPLITEVKTELTAEAKTGATVLKVVASEGAHPFTVGMQIVVLGSEYAEGRTVKAILSSTEIEINAALSIAHANAAAVRQATRPYLNPIYIRYPHALIVDFYGCQVPGRSYFGYDNNGYQYGRNVTFTKSRILDYETCDEHCIFVIQEGAPNEGGKPPIKFTDCSNSVGGGGYQHNINGTVNGSLTTGTRPELHTLRFKTSEGKLPQSSGGGTASLTSYIPKDAVITAVRSYKGAVGTKTNKNWIYKLLDLSNGEAVIAEVKGGETVEWKTGWNLKEQLNLHITGAGNHWGLKLTCEHVEEGIVASYFEVDYVA